MLRPGGRFLWKRLEVWNGGALINRKQNSFSNKDVPHPLVHLSSAHGKHVETSLPTNNVYLHPAAMECHCLNFPFSWMTTLKETVRLWSASWQERKHGGLRNIKPNKRRMELPPSSTRYPQQNKRHIFFPQVEGFLDKFEKKRNIYKWCHNPFLSKNVVKMWGVRRKKVFILL